MCALATGIADAHTLHIRHKTFALSQTKYTTPSLAFAIPNEATWYGMLTKSNISDTLHVKHNDITYSLCEPFTDTLNYTYDNDGRLIGADEDLYLQSTGTEYVDTGFSPNNNSYLKIDFYHTQTARSHIAFAGEYINNSSTLSYGFGITGISGVNTTAFVVYNGYNQNGYYWRIEKSQITGKGTGRYLLTLDKRNAAIAGLAHTFPNTQYSGNKSIFLFASNTPTSINTQNSTKIYSCILKDNDVLVRHFVPVPACMRIGDFIVPENGMWDIVNQQFYGNSGTGSFIYGKDE